MSAAAIFLIAAAALLLAVLAILLRPLLRSSAKLAAADAHERLERRGANLAIYRDQLRELERDRREGLLAEADFDLARRELQRRLLDEAGEDAAAADAEPAPARAGGRKTALALAVSLPLAAVAGYLLLGRPQAMDPANVANATSHVSRQQIDAMVGQLAERLKANPDDVTGWSMLARSYKVLGRYAESADAYAQATKRAADDPALLAEYADTLIQLADGKFEGKPAELVARALELNPDEGQALYLAGAAASERGDQAGVVKYWGRLMAQLPADSQDAKVLGPEVAKARAQLGESAGDKPAAAGAEAVGGEVVLGGKVAAQARPDDLLFVFARPDEGSRMPLAVLRARVADLPLTFNLDDSMALPGGQKISQFPSVSVEARIAKAGKAQTSSGDLFGSVKGVKPGSRGIKVVIDQVQP